MRTANANMSAKQSKQSGFVLLATLFALVVISIMAGYFAQRVAQIRDAAQIELDTVTAETDFASFRAQLSYAANLNVVTARGLEEGAVEIEVREAHQVELEHGHVHEHGDHSHH